jgi:hypothetical protein
MRGNGSHGDPGPDDLLPAAAADALLDGHLALASEELRSLADTVAALCGPPSEAELRGEARARAAYRAVRPGVLHDPGAPSHRHTLPLELRAASRHRRTGRSMRARHRSTGSARPHPPSGRRGMGGRLGLVSGVAAAVIAAAAGFAYAGGAFSTHVKSLSSAAPPSSAHPSASASGSAGVAGISAAHAPKDKPAPTATAAASNAPADTPQALCEAWLKNPWRPWVKNWDDEDFDKLSTLAGSPQMVLFYCWTKLPRDYWGSAPGFHYPPGYSNGHWDWTPGSKPPAQGNGPSQNRH